MTDPTSNEAAQDRELTIIRDYDAPARLLFKAWSKPEYIARWFGPVGWPITLCEMDFRVGGSFRFAMTGPDGIQNTPFGGEYLEIVPNRRIVFTNGFEQPGAEKMVMTVTFEENGGRTRLTHHTLFASRAMYEDHVGKGFEEGTNSGLDQLAEVVRDMQKASA